MKYISRAFKKIGERISHLFCRHEPVQEYSFSEPGYTEQRAHPEPGFKRHDAITDLPGFDPKDRIYKPVKIGHRKPKVGQKRKPKAEYLPSYLKRRPTRKSKKEEQEEYIEPTIIELKKKTDKEDEKNAA